MISYKRVVKDVDAQLKQRKVNTELSLFFGACHHGTPPGSAIGTLLYYYRQAVVSDDAGIVAVLRPIFCARWSCSCIVD